MSDLRSFWNEIPAVRLLLPYVVGVLFFIGVLQIQLPASFYEDVVFVSWIGLFLSGIALCYFNYLKNPVQLFRFRFLAGVVLFLTLFFLGNILTWYNTDTFHANHLAHQSVNDTLQHAKFYVAQITEPTLVRAKKITAIAEVKELYEDSLQQQVSGKAMVTLPRDTFSEQLQYGDVILFHGNLKELDAPRNPNEFNYKQYQSFHNIYHRINLKSDEWKNAKLNSGNRILKAIYRIRTYFLSLILQSVPKENELAVATAIMLGYRDYMNSEVVQAYSSSGALHVLSVSGLHVGIVFMMLQLFLGWMERSQKLKWIRAVLIIGIISFYAILTGLSPSVLRAVVMFGMIIIAKTIDREVSTYNVLATSCLLLLFWNPYLITEVGFKLSYLAVLGIVYMHPIIYERWQTKNYILDKAWGIISISIAAQIATFPLSILYFHQFPNLFLLSNLIVIPVSDFILWAGMGLFAVGWCKPLLTIVGWVFNFLLVGLNKFIFWIDGLSFALIERLVITQFEMYVIYLLIIFILWMIAEKRAKVFIASLVCVLVLATVNVVEAVRNSKQNQLVVYSVPGKSAIAFLDRRNVYYDFDTALLNNESSMLFHVKHHWWESGVKTESKIDTSQNQFLSTTQMPFGKLFVVNDFSVLVVDQALPKTNDIFQNRLKVDVVILSHNPKVYLENLKKIIDFDEVVFDTSNKRWRINYWKKDCEQLKLKYHDCAEYAYLREI